MIAREAGISEPILYRHFGSKRDLYIACLDAAWARLRAAYDAKLEELGYERAVLAIGQASFEFHASCDVRPTTLWIQALSEAGGDAEIPIGVVTAFLGAPFFVLVLRTIFLFNGIQNSTSIYQPVLQWGPSAAGGGNFWTVASWYVDGAGGTLRIGRRRFRMLRASRAAQATRSARIRVRLTRRGTRALRRALRRKRRASVRIGLRATDRAGNRSPLVRATVRVRR